MQVHPMLSDKGERVYEIQHISDTNTQRTLYQQPLEKQIEARQIVARQFCKGVAAISNLDLPFSNDGKKLDENDGLLLIAAIRQGELNIDSILQKMQTLAMDATGVHSSEELQRIDKDYQHAMGEIDQIVKSTHFNQWSLLDGSQEQLQIPRGNGESITIRMANLSTGSAGMNIITTSVNTEYSAREALGELGTVRDSVRYSLQDLATRDKTIAAAIASDADVTLVDVSNDGFRVQHQTTYPVLSPLPVTAAATKGCYQATDGCLLLVHPSNWVGGKRRYGFQTVCQGSYPDPSLLYYHGLTAKEQINKRVFMGRTFCQGVLSLSDMHLPFPKERDSGTDFQDANDGLLLVKATLQGLDEIHTLLLDLQTRAVAASKAPATEAEVSAFADLLTEVDRVVQSRIFDRYLILDGYKKTFIIPIHHEKEHVSVAMTNATTGDRGLNIAMLAITTEAKAQAALQPLAKALQTIEAGQQQLAKVKPVFEAALGVDETVSIVDISGPQFIFR
jgi:flagellin-like hook-associated protein FlgL